MAAIVEGALELIRECGRSRFAWYVVCMWPYGKSEQKGRVTRWVLFGRLEGLVEVS